MPKVTQPIGSGGKEKGSFNHGDGAGLFQASAAAMLSWITPRGGDCAVLCRTCSSMPVAHTSHPVVTTKVEWS